MDVRHLEDLAREDDYTARRLVESLLALRGMTRKDLDRRLGRTPGYVSQVLNGTVGLKLSTLLLFVRALDFEPEVFFRTLYKRGRPLSFSGDPESTAEVLSRLREIDMEPGAAKAQRQPSDMAAFEALVQRAVSDALARSKDEGGS
jgi:transcriptional regulator with XRE-family HTH domain